MAPLWRSRCIFRICHTYLTKTYQQVIGVILCDSPCLILRWQRIILGLSMYLGREYEGISSYVPWCHFLEKLLQTPLSMPISKLEPICKHGSSNAANPWRLIQFDPLTLDSVYMRYIILINMGHCGWWFTILENPRAGCFCWKYAKHSRLSRQPTASINYSSSHYSHSQEKLLLAGWTESANHSYPRQKKQINFAST